MSFRLKTIIQVTTMVLLFSTSISMLHEAIQSDISKRANTNSQLFASLAKDSLLSYDLTTLNAYTEEIMKLSEVVYVKVLDTEGGVLASAGNPDYLTKAFREDDNPNNVEDDIEFNPDSVEPILKDLCNHISWEYLKPIHNEINAFNFDQALLVTHALAEKMDIKWL